MKRLLLAAMVLALGSGVAVAQTVRLGTEGAYPPYNFVNGQGEIDGFERELGDALCKRASLTCEWVRNDWDTIIPNLQAGDYDVIIAGMSITDERAKVIEFTQFYIPPKSSAYLAASADADVGGTIAAQVGTLQSAHVAASGATLLEVEAPDEAVAAVRNGKADAVLADESYLQPIADQSGGALVLLAARVQLGGGVGLGLRKSDTALKGKFDQGITEMKADGSLDALIKKWFGYDTGTD